MDEYDQAVEFLTNNPLAMKDAWSSPSDLNWLRENNVTDIRHIAACLFQYANKVGVSSLAAGFSEPCGCLTQVKLLGYKACTPELTEAIRKDDRIPLSVECIKILPKEERRKVLNVFAEWQRKLDVELGRVNHARAINGES